MEKIRIIPCSLSKNISGNNKFLSLENAKIKELDMTTAHSILARYYKGVGGTMTIWYWKYG